MLRKLRIYWSGIITTSSFGLFALTMLILVAAALRFYKLGEWSFWEDEVFSISSEEDGFNFSIWRRSLAIDLIQVTTETLGTNEWTARLAPALIGVATIPILFFPVRRQFGVYVAWIFAGLLAVSHWHIYWSQNARFYTLLFLFYNIALLYFFTALELDRPLYMVISLVFIGLAARERLIALALVPILVAYLILVKFLPIEKPTGLRPRNLAIFFTPGLIAGLFFVGPYLRNIAGWAAGFGRLNTNPVWLASVTIYYIGLATFCLGAFGALLLLLKKNRAGLFLVLNALGPIFMIMVMSLFQFSATRYAFVSLPSWLLLAALFIFHLFQELNGNAKILAAGILALLLIAPMSENLLYYRVYKGNRADWRSAFDYIKANKLPSEVVISSEPDVGNYYLGETTRSYLNWEVPRIAQSGLSFWFVEDLSAEERYPAQVAWIRQNATAVANFDVNVYARYFLMRVYYYPGRE
jgi:hypothetical protein